MSSLPEPLSSLNPGPLSPASSLDAVLEPGGEGSALRAELEGLNERLKVLRSSDLALRAYLCIWGAFVSLAVAGKLFWDGRRSDDGVSLLAGIFLAIGLGLLFDAVRSKIGQRRLAKREAAELERQRTLRRRLGLEETSFR